MFFFFLDWNKLSANFILKSLKFAEKYIGRKYANTFWVVFEQTYFLAILFFLYVLKCHLFIYENIS